VPPARGPRRPPAVRRRRLRRVALRLSPAPRPSPTRGLASNAPGCPPASRPFVGRPIHAWAGHAFIPASARGDLEALWLEDPLQAFQGEMMEQLVGAEDHDVQRQRPASGTVGEGNQDRLVRFLGAQLMRSPVWSRNWTTA
jgi:hypothetical protein